MNLLCLFGHDWYYARGRSKGVIVGGVRHSCVRRVCKRCKSEQEINRFTDSFMYKGDYFNGHPEWVDEHTTTLQPSPRWDKSHSLLLRQLSD